MSNSEEIEPISSSEIEIYKPGNKAPMSLLSCTICKEEKPATEEFFYPRKDAKKKFRSRCKVCYAKYFKQYSESANGKFVRSQYVEKNKSVIAEKYRVWKAVNEEKVKESKKRYYEGNKDTLNLRMRIRYKNNQEEVKKYVELWRCLNRDKVNGYNRKRRAIKSSLSEHHTLQDIKDLYDEQLGLCFYCGEFLYYYDVDHKTPLSRNGSNTKENLCISCPTCNARKHDKTEEEFYDFLLKEDLLCQKI